MIFPTVQSFLSLSALFLLTNAWPVIPGFRAERQLERRASYSVVAVDGGSSTQPATTATVTNAIIKTQTVITTSLSTTVVTESNTPITIIITITSTSATTIIETPAVPIATSIIATTLDSSSSPSSSQTSPTDTPPYYPNPVTVTVTESALPSTRPYDDGMWHTKYYYTVPAEVVTVESVPAPTPTYEGGRSNSTTNGT